MIPKLRNLQCITLDPVDYAMLVSEAAGPEARQGTFQRSGLAKPHKGFALGFADQLVDSFDYSLVLLLLVEVIFPGLVGENQLHSASSRSTPFPAFS